MFGSHQRLNPISSDGESLCAMYKSAMVIRRLPWRFIVSRWNCPSLFSCRSTVDRGNLTDTFVAVHRSRETTKQIII